MTVATRPRQVFAPHPLLGWRLRPDARVHVHFRPDVVQTIGADGWRTVPGRVEGRRPILAVYGCSFTYGTGLADAETFCALLQAAFPQIAVRNRGVGGHGTVQNLLQFRREVVRGEVDAAIFAMIGDHRYRNIGHPQRMKLMQAPLWYVLGVEHLPVARRSRDGRLKVDYVPIWQPSLARRDFEDFLPDERMIDEATLSVCDEVRALAAGRGIPLCFALLDQNDPTFNALMRDRFGETLDISVPHDSEHILIPHDIHPTPHANRLYAERLSGFVASAAAAATAAR